MDVPLKEKVQESQFSIDRWELQKGFEHIVVSIFNLSVEDWRYMGNIYSLEVVSCCV